MPENYPEMFETCVLISRYELEGKGTESGSRQTPSICVWHALFTQILYQSNEEIIRMPCVRLVKV